MSELSDFNQKYFVIGLLFVIGIFAPIESIHAATYNIFYSFAGRRHGSYPRGGLLPDNSGDLFGTTVGRVGDVYELSPSGKEAILFHDFSRAVPSSGLIADNAGNYYGTTEWGGGSANCKYGCGTVYRLSPNGTETILYAFKGGSTDGYYPQGGLVSDASGNLYGTTEYGAYGNSAYCTKKGGGCGIVYKIAPDGTETILHVFQGGTTDGSRSTAGLIFDSAGNLYGTTQFPSGTVFKLSPDGTYSVIYFFKGVPDGALPFGELIMDAAGNLYGTTAFGGSNTGTGCYGHLSGCGTIFEITPSGTETVLYSFSGGNDGDTPENGMAIDSTGNLYGVTAYGGGTGCNGYGCGTVFQLVSGVETVLHSFEGGNTDGEYPQATPLLYNGRLYGTTTGGGAENFGTVFEITFEGQ